MENRLAFIRKREADAVDRLSKLKNADSNRESSFREILLEMQKENKDLKEQVFEVRFHDTNLRCREKSLIMLFPLHLASKRNRIIEKERGHETECDQNRFRITEK